MDSPKYNYNKLRGLIREFFGSQKAYADALGISLTTLNSRLNGDTYFDQREMEISAEAFHLDANGLNQVFFLREQYGNP